MIPYNELSPMIRGILGISDVLLSVVAVYILVTVCVLQLRRCFLFLSIVLMGTVVCVSQGIVKVNIEMTYEYPYGIFSNTIGSFPWVLVVLMLLVQAICAGIFLKLIWHRKNNLLTPGALKESLDTLPDGVCFFEKNGQPLLVNIQMNRISGELFGAEILNGEQFWKDIRENFPEMVQTKDGKIWDFRRKDLVIRKKIIYEIVACDVTEQYKLKKELEKRNQSLGEINERLRFYGQEVDRITRDQEILTAKIRLHDELGRSLLAFRSYLDQTKEQRDHDGLLRLWHYNIAALRNEASPSEMRDDWALLRQAADAVDVKIFLDGDIPKEEKIESIIIKAIHECLTNTVKHANGNELYVKIRNNNVRTTVEMSNNGNPPTHTVKESGGLLNLRHTVERAGGTMVIESTPQFMLQVTLPAGGMIYG